MNISKFCLDCQYFLAQMGIIGQRQTKLRFLMLGLDGAGKTTILYKLKLRNDFEDTPTGNMLFNMETIRILGMHYLIQDIVGRKSLRCLWWRYFIKNHGLIWVVDSTDRTRIKESRDELHKVIKDIEMKKTVLLVFANKQDLPQAMKSVEIEGILELNRIKDHRWTIIPSCAKYGYGLYKGLEWLTINHNDFFNLRL